MARSIPGLKICKLWEPEGVKSTGRMKGTRSMRSKLRIVALGLVSIVLSASASIAAESEPPASPEVTAAMQPYLDQYKLAGVIGIIADRNGKVHYKNLLGYANVEAKEPIREDNVFWIASMSKMFA
jgi:CubicO group peptidase (beta-lactamase class C family)